MVKWRYDGDERDFSSYIGFLYRIDFTDGSCYFGKKNFTKQLRYKPLKGKKRVRLVTRESDWRTYEGSSTEKGTRVVQRKTILKLCRTKGELNYGEVEMLVNERVLFRADCLNKNIPKNWYASNCGAKKWKWSKDKE